jgi:hypothetical protein
LDLVVEVRNQLGPVLETDLEDLSFVDLRDLDEVEVGVDEHGAVRLRLEDLDVRGEEVGEEEGEVKDELLVGVARGGVGTSNICNSASVVFSSERRGWNGPVEGGIILLTLVMTLLKRLMNFELYSAPICRPPISERHLRVTLRNSGTSRNCRRPHQHRDKSGE